MARTRTLCTRTFRWVLYIIVTFGAFLAFFQLAALQAPSGTTGPLASPFPSDVAGHKNKIDDLTVDVSEPHEIHDERDRVGLIPPSHIEETAWLDCRNVQGLSGILLWTIVRELNVTSVARADVLSAVAEAGVFIGSSCIETCARTILKTIFHSSGKMSRVQSSLNEAASRLDVNIDGERLPAESHSQSCLAMMVFAALGGFLQQPHTAAIEQGTFMGYSTRCIAAGVKINKRMVLYAFDMFNYIPAAKSVWKRSDMVKKTESLKIRKNYMAQVSRNILPWTARLIPGPIGKLSGERGGPSDYDDKQVAFFAMDASKDLHFFVTALRLVSRRFLPNSIMVLGDSLMENAICGQVGSVIETLVPHGKVTLLWYSRSTSHTAWLVKEPFSLKSTKGSQRLAKTRIDVFMAGATNITRELYGLDVSDDRNLNRMQRLLRGCSIAVEDGPST